MRVIYTVCNWPGFTDHWVIDLGLQANYKSSITDKEIRTNDFSRNINMFREL